MRLESFRFPLKYIRFDCCQVNCHSENSVLVDNASVVGMPKTVFYKNAIVLFHNELFCSTVL